MKNMLVPLVLMVAASGYAQPLVSPEVHSDRRVTFRLKAADARDVKVRLETVGTRPMQQNEQGVWSFTTDPLEPDIYAYSFLVDGVQTIDPSNPLLKYNLLNTESQVHVPGPSTLAWEINDVPHGVIHRHFYRSAIVGDDRPFLVYTPPGYDPAAKQPYPVLYLLHGYSDAEDAWVTVGRANIILDNLIARGQARPMLIVMPLGYGNKEVIANGWAGLRKPGVWQDSVEKFRDSLLKEVIPQVEKAYRVDADPNARAIAGLSMGGTQSLFIGLNAPERFAWIGAFSSGGLDPNFAKQYPAVNESLNSRLRLLWIGCGRQDGLIGANQKLVEWLTSKGVQHTWVETSGSHSFMLWRRYLADFLPLLFQDKPSLVLTVEGFGGEFGADEEGRMTYTRVQGKAGVGPSEEKAKANLKPIRIGKDPSGQTLLFFEQDPAFWGRRIFYLDATSGVRLHPIMALLFQVSDLESKASAGDKSAGEGITNFLTHESPLVRLEAAEALERTGSSASVPKLKAASENENNAAVKAAIQRAIRKLDRAHEKQ